MIASPYTLCEVQARADLARKHRRSRAVSGSRFKTARLTACLSLSDAGKLFRVTTRTVRNWEAGRQMVPYAAFKLMRIVRGWELPGPHWKGFRLRGDTLWSPEGKPFHSWDFTWWSLTVGMAHEFRRMVAAQRSKGGQTDGVAVACPTLAANGTERRLGAYLLGVEMLAPYMLRSASGVSIASAPAPKTLPAASLPPTTLGDTYASDSAAPLGNQPRVVIRGALKAGQNRVAGVLL